MQEPARQGLLITSGRFGSQAASQQFSRPVAALGQKRTVKHIVSCQEWGAAHETTRGLRRQPITLRKRSSDLLTRNLPTHRSRTRLKKYLPNAEMTTDMNTKIMTTHYFDRFQIGSELTETLEKRSGLRLTRLGHLDKNR
jgi:hypothetical protein